MQVTIINVWRRKLVYTFAKAKSQMIVIKYAYGLLEMYMTIYNVKVRRVALANVSDLSV